MAKYGKYMIGFGVFLFACGVLGWAAAGFTAKAKTAVLSGAVTGGVMLTLGLAVVRTRGLTRRSAQLLGTWLPLLFGGIFAWRAVLAWSAWAHGAPKLYVAALLTSMAGAAALTFAVLLIGARRTA